jgi:monoamine oxidase
MVSARRLFALHERSERTGVPVAQAHAAVESSRASAKPRIVIVGAGLAGLRCAQMLWTQSPGAPVQSTVYEANAHRAGGRC